MSSFARIYGVEYILKHKKYYMDIACKWCQEHNNTCDIFLDDLLKVDEYFKSIL